MRAPDARVAAGGASCGVWWKDVPRLEGDAVGAIGRWPEGLSADAAAALLAAAEERLRRAGCARVVAPLDGTTWHAYRFVTHSNGDAPFLGEPTMQMPRAFASAGHMPIARYRSTLVPLPARAAPRPLPAGISLVPLDPGCRDETLDTMHALSCATFPGAFLFAPVDRAAFGALYEPLWSCIDPELVLLAQDEAGPVGFLLAYPDVLAPADTPRVVLKSLAVHPRARGQGLGTGLMDRAEQRAARRGFRQAIHALSRDGNPSQRHAGRGAHVLRRYALLGRTLGASPPIGQARRNS